MKLTGRRLLVLALLAALPAPRSASGQIFRWKDSEDEMHYSQGIDSVPPRYRRDAVIVAPDPSPPVARPDEAPASPHPPGTGRVTFTPGRPIIVAAGVNGAGSARLVLDTEAPRTIIKTKVLMRLGVDYVGSQLSDISGIAGAAKALTVRIQRLDVGGAWYGPIMVVSENPAFEPEPVDGVLGRDFLDHFTVSIDNQAGTLTLTPK